MKTNDKDLALLKQKERELLEHVASQNLETRKMRLAGAPEVGIFWLFEGKLLAEGSYLTQAEDYGDFKNHARSHAQVWSDYQRRIGNVPRDVEYDEVPRGRVVYFAKSKQFIIYADRCILKQKVWMDKIKNEFNLPSTTKAETDSHYLCPKCMR